MIGNEAEYQAAQREMRYLRNFLERLERSADDPNKDLSILGIYRKLDSLWNELEEYYRARLSEMERAA